MLGAIELNRPFPGAIEPARPGRGSNTAIVPLYMKPSPSVMTPDGMPSVCVMVNALPSSSTTAICVVLRGSGALRETRDMRALAGADARRDLLRVLLREQAIERHVDEGGITDMRVLVDGDALHRLGQHGDVFGRVVAELGADRTAP